MITMSIGRCNFNNELDISSSVLIFPIRGSNHRYIEIQAEDWKYYGSIVNFNNRFLFDKFVYIKLENI